MDGLTFDRLTRVLATVPTRRSLVGLLTGLSLGPLVDRAGDHTEVLAHERRAHRRRATTRSRQDRRHQAHGEACIPTGKPCRSKKPRGHDKHGDARMLSCKRCCQKNVATEGGETKCACKPEGLACGGNTQCCLGVCRNGLCNAKSTPPPPQ